MNSGNQENRAPAMPPRVPIKSPAYLHRLTELKLTELNLFIRGYIHSVDYCP